MELKNNADLTAQTMGVYGDDSVNEKKKKGHGVK
jgi:hypothetical protein